MTAAQVWHDTVRGEPHRGVDIGGQRFGELTAVRAVDRDDTGSMVWLCRCDCGRVALRSVGKLRYAVKCGHTPMCLKCLIELRHGMYLQHVLDAAQQWLNIYATIGSLYSAEWAEHAVADIVDDLESRGWPRPCTPLPRYFTIPDMGETQARGGQRAAYLVPITADRGWVWRCYECGAEFKNGFTCMACRAGICRGCISDEAHTCVLTLRTDWEQSMRPDNLKKILLSQYPGRRKEFSREEREARRKSRLMELVRDVEEQVSHDQQKREKYVKSVERQRQRAGREELDRHLRRMKKQYPSLFREMQGERFR